jgi:hypothetical protein
MEVEDLCACILPSLPLLLYPTLTPLSFAIQPRHPMISCIVLSSPNDPPSDLHCRFAHMLLKPSMLLSIVLATFGIMYELHTTNGV